MSDSVEIPKGGIKEQDGKVYAYVNGKWIEPEEGSIKEQDKKMYYVGPQMPQQPQQRGGMATDDNEYTTPGIGRTILDAGIGAADLGVSLLSAVPTEVGAGGAGLYGLQDGGLSIADKNIEQFREDWTRSPKTEYGQRGMKNIADVLTPLLEFADKAGDKVNATSLPFKEAFATMTRMGVEGLPGLLGFRLKPKGTRAQVKQLEQTSKDMGIDIDADLLTQEKQIGQAGEVLTEGAERNTGAEAIKQDLKTKSEIASDAVDAKYLEARKGSANIDRDNLISLRDELNDIFNDENYNIDQISATRGRLDRLDNIIDKDQLDASLHELFTYRKSLNEAARKSPKETRELSIIRDKFDQFMTDKAVNDLIYGDKKVLSNYRKAIASNAEYKTLFSDNKIIKSIIDNEINVTEVRRLLLGQGQVPGTKAADTVIALKKALGDDAPSIQALRNEMILDVVDPLTADSPKLTVFMKNYERVIKKNKSVMDELLTDTQRAELETLYKFAKNNQEMTTAVLKGGKQKIDIYRSISVMMFGNKLAKAALRVNLFAGLLKFLRRGNVSNRRQMIANILGYDAEAPMITSDAALALSNTQTIGRSEDGNTRSP